MDKPQKTFLSRRTFFGAGAVTATASALHFSADAATTKGGEMSYRNHLTFATGAKTARGIATGLKNEIYVAVDREILVFSPEGERNRRIAINGEPNCVAISQGGFLYVGVKDHVEIFGQTGDPSARWKSPGSKVRITDIAVKEDGSVFISDGGNRVIWHLDKKGNVIHQLDHEGKKFATPRDFFPIAVQSNGHLAVANSGRHRIENYDASGKLEAAWGKKSRSGDGFGGCCNPISFALTSDGGFITAEGGLPKVKRFDASGHFLGLVAGPDDLEANARHSHEDSDQPATCHSGGLEVAVDSRDRVLLLDRVTAEVTILIA